MPRQSRTLPVLHAALLVAAAALLAPAHDRPALADGDPTSGRAISGLAFTGDSASAEPSATATAPKPVPGGSTLMILSTTDVKGKTSPCGCHTPKGGLARRANVADSVKVEHDQVLIVDSGGFFPEQEDYERDAAFMTEAMKTVGVDAAGLGARDLRFGRAFLLAQVRRTKLDVVCANLYDTKTKKPVLDPWTIHTVGKVKVGVFGVISDKMDLGPSRDSIMASDPVEAARTAVAELKKKGATVIVALSELGKVESEDLSTAVDGIDVMIAGLNVPLIQRGRLVKNTIIAYGGEQSQYMGMTTLQLDGAGRKVAGTSEMLMLSPEVGEKPAMLATVKKFEDDFNEYLRRREKEHQVADAAAKVNGTTPGQEGTADHYLGSEVCARCHQSEYTQWQTTAHAKAWATLVDKKVDGRPDCIPCHVTGYKQAGGFQTGDDAPRLGNVQCENCHGMGTKHESYTTTTTRVTEATCRSCHNETTSPKFSFDVYQPHIVHTPVAALPPLPPRPAVAPMMMKTSGSH